MECLYTNKEKFVSIFCSKKKSLTTSFEISFCFNENGKLDTDPTKEEHSQSFRKLFKKVEETIFKNENLSNFMHELPSQLFDIGVSQENRLAEYVMKRSVGDMEHYLKGIVEYSNFDNQIMVQLNKDLALVDDKFILHRDVEEIYDYSKAFQEQMNSKTISLEMDFYA